MLSPEYTDVGSFERLEVCCEDCRLDSGSETTLFPCYDSFLMFLVVLISESISSLESEFLYFGICVRFNSAESDLKFTFLIGVEVCTFPKKSLLCPESSPNGFEVEYVSKSESVYVATFGIPQV